MPFHKSCYTSRCSGYKYRTLSTNTGERKKIHRTSMPQPEVSAVDQKFHSIHEDISSLISKELEETERSRGMILEKFEKVDAKINSMLELQDNVLAMRQTLAAAGGTLEELYQKIQKIEVMSELNSIKMRKSPPQPKSRVTEEEAEQELFCSEYTQPASAPALTAI